MTPKNVPDHPNDQQGGVDGKRDHQAEKPGPRGDDESGEPRQHRARDAADRS